MFKGQPNELTTQQKILLGDFFKSDSFGALHPATAPSKSSMPSTKMSSLSSATAVHYNCSTDTNSSLTKSPHSSVGSSAKLKNIISENCKTGRPRGRPRKMQNPTV